MRARVGTSKMKEPVETDKQIEIWCRVVLMRFDPKELQNVAHLNAIAKHIVSDEVGPQLQALQAFTLLGEKAGPKVDVVVEALRADDMTIKTVADIDALVLGGTLNALAAMGTEAKGSIPYLEKMDKKLAKMKEDRINSDEFRKLTVDLKPEQLKILISNLPEEQMRKSVLETIDYINKSKPGLPGGVAVGAAPPPVEKKP